MPYLKGDSGIDWHYDIEGEGALLLFLHGWGVDRRIWRQQAKFFTPDYKVMTIDLPGHGKSSWQKVSLESMAYDLKGILGQLREEELTLIGSSLGGMLALKFYEIWPEMIGKMVFVGSMPKFVRSEDYPYGLDRQQMQKLSEQLHTAYPAIIHIFFRSLFTRQERESRRFKWLQKFRRTTDVPARHALREYLDILAQEDLRGVLRNVQCPVQFINGTHDEICDRKTVAYLQELAPRSRFDFFEQCGHFPFLSKPHEFNGLLQQFLGNV